jgi:hypothetical protein
MFQAALSPCNGSDIRQRWIYNATRGTLATEQAFAEQPSCLMTAFAHAIRGSSVSVAICRATGPNWAVTKEGFLSTAGPNPASQATASKPKAECVVRTDSTPIEAALGIGQLQVYGGRVAHGYGVGLTNVDSLAAHPITVQFEDLGVGAAVEMRVRDVWGKRDLGAFQGNFTARVGAHDTVLLRLEPVGDDLPSITRRLKTTDEQATLLQAPPPPYDDPQNRFLAQKCLRFENIWKLCLGPR